MITLEEIRNLLTDIRRSIGRIDTMQADEFEQSDTGHALKQARLKFEEAELWSRQALDRSTR